jgi:predicted GNAT superfamily acetyltransferase
MRGITIRRLTTVAEMHLADATMRQIWDFGPADSLPVHLLITVAKNGGLVLGAWDGETLAGVLFGFLGMTPAGTLKHCSHTMGVQAAYRGQGVALALKWAQREIVLGQGIDLISWTYNPLETPNAALNMNALGAICRTYWPNIYGELADSINGGLLTDRFEVEWWLNSERVARRAAGERGAPAALPEVVNGPGALTATGWPLPAAWAMPTAASVAVVVPRDFQALRQADPALALAWQHHARDVFQGLFAAGYVAHQFQLPPAGPFASYLLNKGDF